jgi:hypothetical protein
MENKEKRFEGCASAIMQHTIPTYEREVSDQLDQIKEMIDFTINL